MLRLRLIVISSSIAFVWTAVVTGSKPVYVQPPTPEVNPWEDKGISSRYEFGAYHTRKTPEKDTIWHDYSRTDEYADIMVRFGPGEEQIVFGRESSYLPIWHGTTRKRAFPEIVTRHGDGPWYRPDRINRHARARVIESSAERVVIHWRYLPLMQLPLPGRLPDQTKFVDEYFVIYPDRTVVRGILRGQPRYEDWRASAPGEVFRYQLDSQARNDIAQLEVTKQDEALMLGVMSLQPMPSVQPNPVKTLPAGFPRPVAEMTFDDREGRVVADSTANTSYPVLGHSALWRPGISGTSLEFDGWTTQINTRTDLGKLVDDQLTIDFYLAIAAYPWGPCSLMEQGKTSENGERVRGLFVDLDPDGRIIVAVKQNGDWLRLTTRPIPRHQWTRITAVLDATAPESAALYVNGSKVGNADARHFELTPGGTMTIGKGGEQDPRRPRNFTERYRYTFDGLIDELRIFDVALSESQVAAAVRAFGGKPAAGVPTHVTRYGFPTNLSDVREFAAHYEHLNFHPAWDRMFRMGGHPDVVVTFDKHPTRYVLWHGVGYIPMMVNENNFWYSNEFNETWGRGGSAEPMSDKRMVYGCVEVLEQSPARVVLKWRYPLSDIHYEIHGERTDWADANWGKWATWYITIYPDGSIVKRMRVYSGRPAPLEWHESMGMMAPNQKPEEILDTQPALTLVALDGEVRKYDWIGSPPTNVSYDNAVLHIVNMVGNYDPYTIQRIRRGNVYKTNNEGTGYSPFPSWNHWPVAQLPSDRFDTSHPHRAAHSSLTHIYWDDSTPHGEQGLFVEKLLLEGMSNRPAEELLPLAKSWLQPAAAESGPGITTTYSAAERAYVLTRHSGDVKSLSVKLNASPESPLVNPVFIIPNAATKKVGKVAIEGAQPSDLRQGIVRRANGVSALVVWTELESDTPLDVRIDLP